MPLYFSRFYHNQLCRKRRMCKTGGGTEANLGKCDTPGFPLTAEPEVKFDHRRSQKLYMPRNHRRINQCSTQLLQSWRGNCDIQILVYNCDPKAPNINEIARVTDYVVAYSCKGNSTVKEEREQNRKLLLAYVFASSYNYTIFVLIHMSFSAVTIIQVTRMTSREPVNA